MASEKITQAEAEQLLSMLKRSLINKITFPQKSKSIEFDLEGDTKKDIFCINIYRGKINDKKYNIGARIKKNNILLLELHIGSSNVHINPSNGEKICGNHWHQYTETYGRSFAFPAENIEDDKFVENTILFFNKFNVIKQPKIQKPIEKVEQLRLEEI